MPTVGFAIAFIRRGDGSAAFTALKKKKSWVHPDASSNYRGSYNQRGCRQNSVFLQRNFDVRIKSVMEEKTE